MQVSETHEQYTVRKTKEYNEFLRAHPADIAMWIDYADFQVWYGMVWYGMVCEQEPSFIIQLSLMAY